jgi:hypothetical protein
MTTPKVDKDQLDAKQQGTLQTPKGNTLGRSDLLTPSEIESLRQDGREASAHMRKRLKSQTKPK